MSAPQNATLIHLARETGSDVCPMCGATLGQARGATRRQIVFCAQPGVFRWRCPDCAGVWQAVTGAA